MAEPLPIIGLALGVVDLAAKTTRGLRNKLGRSDTGKIGLKVLVDVEQPEYEY